MPGPADLTHFPRPSVAVDVAVLTVAVDESGAWQSLAVLVQRRQDPPGSALPGRFLRERQTISDAVTDVLRIKAGLDADRVAPRLLRIFDDPDRDPRGWTLSLGHTLTLPFRRVAPARGERVTIGLDGGPETGASLLFDHDTIVREAASAIRERYEHSPDPDGLLDEQPFTLAQLRSLHEAVLGEPLRKDTFNRRMLEHLEPLAGPDGSPILRSQGGRPAQVYTRAADLGPSPATQRRLRLPRDDG